MKLQALFAPIDVCNATDCVIDTHRGNVLNNRSVFTDEHHPVEVVRRRRRLKDIQNEAAQEALNKILDREKNYSTACKSDVLRVVRKATRNNCNPYLNLSNSNMNDTSVLVLSSVLSHHPSITAVDLSLNPITEVAGTLLLKVVETSPNITSVSITDTHIPKNVKTAIQAATQFNLHRRSRHLEITATRHTAHQLSAIQQLVDKKIDALTTLHKLHKANIEDAWQQSFTELQNLHKTEKSRIQRHLYILQLRKDKKLARDNFAEEESEERCLWFAQESLATIRTYSVYAIDNRVAITSEEGHTRRELKTEAKHGWATSKHKEKTRLLAEYNVRLVLEDDENAARKVVTHALLGERGNLKQHEQACHATAMELLNQRLEREAAEVRWRRQEELRLEKEKQHKKEREARILMEHQVGRDKEARAEMGRRSTVEREETALRIAILEICKINHSVVQAYSSLIKAEQGRTKTYAAQPTLVVTSKKDQSAIIKHFTGTTNATSQVTRICLSHDIGFPDEASSQKKRPTDVKLAHKTDVWQDISKVVREHRKAYKAKMTEARDTIKENYNEWLPVLYPALCLKKDAPIPEDAVPLVKYSPNELAFIPLPPADQPKTQKLEILGGTITVSCVVQNSDVEGVKITGPASEVENDTLLVENEAIRKAFNVTNKAKHTLTFEVPHNASLQTVVEAINSVSFLSGAAADVVPFERVVRYNVTLRYPSLGKTACDGRGVIATATPFTGCAEAEATCEVSVAVLPSLLHMPTGNAAAVEYIEDTPPDKCALLEDISLRHLSKVVISPTGRFVFSPAIGMSYDGWELKVAIVSGWTDDDVIPIKTVFEDDIAFEQNEGPMRLSHDGLSFGEITEGRLYRCKDVEEKYQPAKGFKIKLSGPEAKAAVLVKFLKKLRYYNSSQNPTEEPREVEISLLHSGFKSSVTLAVNVIGTDDPASMTLQTHRLFYRQNSPTIPEHLRSYVRQIYLPVCEGIVVEDIDTDFFCGGYVVLAMSQQQKGDELGVRPSMLPGLEVVNGDDGTCRLLHNEEDIGELISGAVVTENNAPTSPLGKEQCSEVRIQFGLCVPLTSVQQVLRCVTFTNLGFMPPEGWRKISLSLMLGPSVGPGNEVVSEEEGTLLEDSIELRVVPSLFNIPGVHSKAEYREGSGSVRIAPFEVLSDKEGWVESGYNGGCVWVEFVEGGNEDDVVNLRTGTGNDELRIEVRKGQKAVMPTCIADTISQGRKKLEAFDDSQEVTTATLSLKAATKFKGKLGKGKSEPVCVPQQKKLEATGSNEAPEQESSEKGSLNSSDMESPRSEASQSPRAGALLRDRMRIKAQEAVKERKDRRNSLVLGAKDGMQQLIKRGLDERSGLTSSVSDIYIGKKHKIATLSMARGQLFVQFAKSVARKEVVTVLKSITYSNVNSDPTELLKILRVSVRCSGYAPSQALMQIEIQSVDDVTEIVLTNARPRYRPGNISQYKCGAWQMAGFGKLHLEDPDTTHLDGGGFAVELQGGGVKGDVLTFMTPEQQQLAALQQQFTACYNIAASDGKLLLDNEVVGCIEFPKSSVAGTNNLKATFLKHDPPKLTLAIASYMMSCVCFGTSSKVTTGQRTYVFKVSDADNPQEGKQRVVIDVCKPLIAPPSDKPVNKTIKAGQTVQILDKMNCSVVEGKKDAFLTNGFVEVLLVADAESPEEQDSLVLTGTTAVKDGGLHVGTEFIGRVVVRQDTIRVDFGWASKANSKNLQTLLTTAIHFKSSEDSTPRTRTVNYTVCRTLGGK